MFLFLTGVAGLVLLTGMVYYGQRRPIFSHLKDTISGLGEHGSPFEKQVSLGIFLSVGILLALAGLVPWLMDPQRISPLTGLTMSVSVGYLTAAFFPCDPGSPMSGTSRQQIHNLGGLIEYGGGAYFILQMGTDFARTAGSILLICAVLISFITPIRGLIQRVAEIILFTVMWGVAWSTL